MAHSVRSFNKLLLISLHRRFRLNPHRITLSATNFCNQRESKIIGLEDVAEVLKSRDSWTISQVEDSQKKLFGKTICLNNKYKQYVIDTTTVNFIILKCCEEFGLVENAINYYKCLIESGKKVSQSEIRALLNLVRGVKGLSEEHRKFLYEQYLFLTNKLEVLDDQLLTSCIQFLCASENYLSEAVSLIEKKSTQFNNSAVHWDLIAGAAFKFGQVDLGWESLFRIAKINDPNVTIVDVRHAVTEYIDYCKKKLSEGTFCMEEFDKILQYLADHSISLERQDFNIVLSLKDFLDALNKMYEKDYSWKLSQVTVDRESGYCETCQNYLENFEIDEKSFMELRTTFLSQVIIGKDVFIKSSPEEVKRYYKFLRSSPHFDIIVDGLNIAYSQVGNHREKIEAMLHFINYFIDKKMSVLLLGRKHMRKWPGFQTIEATCATFLFENATDDDAFLLYGALYKGWNTYVCTGDFLRGKTNYFTDLRMIKLFEAWHRTHQYGLIKSRQEIVPPMNHSIYTHKIINSDSLAEGEISWHIAYLSQKTTGYNYKRPFKWLCLQRRSRQTKGFEDITNIHELPLETVRSHGRYHSKIEAEVQSEASADKNEFSQSAVRRLVANAKDFRKIENTIKEFSNFTAEEKIKTKPEKETNDSKIAINSEGAEKIKTSPLAKGLTKKNESSLEKRKREEDLVLTEDASGSCEVKSTFERGITEVPKEQEEKSGLSTQMKEDGEKSNANFQKDNLNPEKKKKFISSFSRSLNAKITPKNLNEVPSVVKSELRAKKESPPDATGTTTAKNDNSASIKKFSSESKTNKSEILSAAMDQKINEDSEEVFLDKAKGKDQVAEKNGLFNKSEEGGLGLREMSTESVFFGEECAREIPSKKVLTPEDLSDKLPGEDWYREIIARVNNHFPNFVTKELSFEKNLPPDSAKVPVTKKKINYKLLAAALAVDSTNNLSDKLPGGEWYYEIIARVNNLFPNFLKKSEILSAALEQDTKENPKKDFLDEEKKNYQVVKEDEKKLFQKSEGHNIRSEETSTQKNFFKEVSSSFSSKFSAPETLSDRMFVQHGNSEIKNGLNSHFRRTAESESNNKKKLILGRTETERSKIDSTSVERRETSEDDIADQVNSNDDEVVEKKILFAKSKGNYMKSQETNFQNPLLSEKSSRKISDGLSALKMNRHADDLRTGNNNNEMNESLNSSKTLPQTDKTQPKLNISSGNSESLEIENQDFLEAAEEEMDENQGSGFDSLNPSAKALSKTRIFPRTFAKLAGEKNLENQNFRSNNFQPPLKSSSVLRRNDFQDQTKSKFLPDVTYSENISQPHFSASRTGSENPEGSSNVSSLFIVNDEDFDLSNCNKLNVQLVENEKLVLSKTPEEILEARFLKDDESFDAFLSALSYKVSNTLFEKKIRNRMKAENLDAEYFDKIAEQIKLNNISKLKDKLKNLLKGHVSKDNNPLKDSSLSLSKVSDESVDDRTRISHKEQISESSRIIENFESSWRITASEDFKPFEALQTSLLNDILDKISESKKQNYPKADIADKNNLVKILHRISDLDKASQSSIKASESKNAEPSPSDSVADEISKTKQKFMKIDPADKMHLLEILNRRMESIKPFKEAEEILRTRPAENDGSLNDTIRKTFEKEQKPVKVEIAHIEHLKEILNSKTLSEEPSEVDQYKFDESREVRIEYLKEILSHKGPYAESFETFKEMEKKSSEDGKLCDDINSSVSHDISDKVSETKPNRLKVELTDLEYLKEISNRKISHTNSFEDSKKLKLASVEGRESSIIYPNNTADEISKREKQERIKTESRNSEHLKEILNRKALTAESNMASEKSEHSDELVDIHSSTAEKVPNNLIELKDSCTNFSYVEKPSESFVSSFKFRQKSEDESYDVSDFESPERRELNEGSVSVSPTPLNTHSISFTSSFGSRSKNSESELAGLGLFKRDNINSEMSESGILDENSVNEIDEVHIFRKRPEESNETLEIKLSEDNDRQESLKSFPSSPSNKLDLISEDKRKRMEAEIVDDSYLKEVLGHVSEIKSFQESKDLQNKPSQSYLSSVLNNAMENSFEGEKGKNIKLGAVFKSEKEERMRTEISDETYINEVSTHVAGIHQDKISKNPEEEQNFFENFLENSSFNEQVCKKRNINKDSGFSSFSNDYSQHSRRNSNQESRTDHMSSKTKSSKWSPNFSLVDKKSTSYSQTGVEPALFEIVLKTHREIVYKDKNNDLIYVDNVLQLPPWAIFKSAFKVSRINDSKWPYWVYIDFELLNTMDNNNRHLSNFSKNSSSMNDDFFNDRHENNKNFPMKNLFSKDTFKNLDDFGEENENDDLRQVHESETKNNSKELNYFIRSQNIDKTKNTLTEKASSDVLDRLQNLLTKNDNT